MVCSPTTTEHMVGAITEPYPPLGILEQFYACRLLASSYFDLWPIVPSTPWSELASAAPCRALIHWR